MSATTTDPSPTPPRIGRTARWRMAGGVAVAALALFASAPPAGASPPENARPARVQVLIRTGDVTDAGTDDPVFVSLADGHKTWLDAPGDDWGRGTYRRYDLTLDNVSSLAGITRLQIGKATPVPAGPVTLFTNDWCLQYVELIVNGQTLFSQSLPRPAGSTCRWLRGADPTFTFTGAQLRADMSWLSKRGLADPGTLLTRSHLTEMVIASTSQTLHAHPDLRWGSLELVRVDGTWTVIPEVHITRLDDRAVHVRLDLAAKTPGYDTEVTVEFDLRFGCFVAGSTRTGPVHAYYIVTRENIRHDEDSSILAEVLYAAFKQGSLDSHIAGEVDKGLDGFAAPRISTATKGCFAQPYVRYNSVDVSFLGF